MLRAEHTALPLADLDALPAPRARLPLWTWALALSAPFYAMVLALHLGKGVPVAYLTQDATTVGGVAWYAGLLSQSGILVWSIAAALCLFSAPLLAGSTRSSDLRAFLTAAGCLAAFLALDDLFRLHETVFPRVLGVAETAVHLTYASLGLLFVLRFRHRIFRRDGALLLAALSCLGASQALDLLSVPGIDPFLLEDSLKFFGIVSWCVYFVHACWVALKHQSARDALRRYLALGYTVDAEGRVLDDSLVQVDWLPRAGDQRARQRRRSDR